MECLRSLRIHCCRDPKNRYTNSECRPDIIMVDAKLSSNLDLDILLAHPWSSDFFPSSAEATGAAANRRETRKMSKYEQHKLLGGSVVNVVPLIMEHFGSWGEEVGQFLQKLAAFSSDEAGRPNAAQDFLYNYRSVTHVMSRNLARCVVGLRGLTLSAPNFSSLYLVIYKHFSLL